MEETLNELLEQEAEQLTQAARYERSEASQGYRSGNYDRNLTTTSGDATLHVPRLKGVSFETVIIERYCRREIAVSPQSVKGKRAAYRRPDPLRPCPLLFCRQGGSGLRYSRLKILWLYFPPLRSVYIEFGTAPAFIGNINPQRCRGYYYYTETGF